MISYISCFAILIVLSQPHAWVFITAQETIPRWILIIRWLCFDKIDVTDSSDTWTCCTVTSSTNTRTTRTCTSSKECQSQDSDGRLTKLEHTDCLSSLAKGGIHKWRHANLTQIWPPPPPPSVTLKWLFYLQVSTECHTIQHPPSPLIAWRHLWMISNMRPKAKHETASDLKGGV